MEKIFIFLGKGAHWIFVALVFILMGVIFNPVLYYIWLLIHPQSASTALYSLMQGGTGTGIVSTAASAWWHTNRLFLSDMLPWRSLRVVLETSELYNAGFQEQLSFFNNSDRIAVIRKNWLSDEVKKHLWDFIESPLRKELRPFMGKLDDKQFYTMVIFYEWDNIRSYLENYTPSEKMLFHLLRATEKDEEAIKILAEEAQKRGLTKGVIASLNENASLKDNKAIRTGLEIFAEKQVVSHCKEDNEQWQKYLQEKDIHEDTQKLMNRMQYSVYHQCRKSLCEKAIIHFLSKADTDLEMAKMVMRYEVFGQEVSEQVKMLIASSPKLTAFAVENL